MQAQAEFVDELVGEMHNENESLKKQIQEMGEQLQDKIKQVVESDSVKHQLQHLETFKNELIRERAAHAESLERIRELENTLFELQSPAKTKVKKAAPKSTLPVEDATVKDGGTF
jgi:cell division septum initiation protein DivIVA